MFAGVPGYPSCGFSRGFTFTDVRGCSLMVVGVPVMIPVRLYRMTRWEDLNPRPLVCRCLPLFVVAFCVLQLGARCLYLRSIFPLNVLALLHRCYMEGLWDVGVWRYQFKARGPMKPLQVRFV